MSHPSQSCGKGGPDAGQPDSYACDEELTNHIDTPGECNRELDELLAAMPVEDREILALRFVAGLSLQEIAHITR